MKNIVLDVSAAYAVITNAPSSKMFSNHLLAAEQVLVPDLFYAEATNAAWKFHHIEDASLEEVTKLAQRAIELFDVSFSSALIWKEALELACQLSHPTYDCYYIVLAQQQEASLLTCDKRLIKVCQKIHVNVIGPK